MKKIATIFILLSIAWMGALPENVQAIIFDDSGGNIFNQPLPDGGNYWSDYDEASEGCEDTAPADGFCDAPKLFLGGADNLPWVRGGWVFPRGLVIASEFVII
jgi:hypothetical protein